MKDILIVNLNDRGSVFQMAHLSHSLFHENPNVRISYLIFEEFRSALEAQSHIRRIFTIPRKRMITYYKTPFYNMGFGIDELEKCLDPIFELSYERIINFSNDRSSALVSSYIKHRSTAPFSGLHFIDGKTMVPCGLWGHVHQEILSYRTPSPFNRVDVIHHQCNVPFFSEGEKIKVNKKNDETVRSHFEKLRNLNKDRPKKIIGIQTKGDKSSDFPTSMIIELVGKYLKSQGCVPVLLFSPNDEERSFVNGVQKALNKQIVSVEVDGVALPSVVKNLDLLITPDHFIKHICDLFKVPYLEVALGPHLFQQKATNVKTKVLSYRIDKRTFIKSENFRKMEKAEPEADMIFKSSQVILENMSPAEVFSGLSNWTLYGVKKDALGSFFVHEAGFIDMDSEIRTIVSRQFLSKISCGSIHRESFHYIVKTFKSDLLQEWIKKEISLISLTVKKLLLALRALVQAQNNPKKSHDFVNSLGHLLECGKNQDLSATAVLIFRGELEGPSSHSKEDNLRRVEGLMYKLKDYTQDILFCLKEIESIILDEKRKKIIEQTKKRQQEVIN